jgi:hypothetical protein
MQILKFAKPVENVTVLTKIPFNMNKGLALKFCLSLFFMLKVCVFWDVILCHWVSMMAP